RYGSSSWKLKSAESISRRILLLLTNCAAMVGTPRSPSLCSQTSRNSASTIAQDFHARVTRGATAESNFFTSTSTPIVGGRYGKSSPVKLLGRGRSIDTLRQNESGVRPK